MASETKKGGTRPSRAKKAKAEANGHVNGQDVTVPSSASLEVAFETYQAGAFDHKELKLSGETLIDMYRNMLLQRRFEERAAQMYGKQKISGFLHLYIGQEAVSTGAANAIEIGTDSVITAYRDHGIALAMGMSADAGMAELFGKIDGCSRGKGGSMHFFDKDLRMMGGHGIVGAHVPVGVGLAFAHKYKEDGGVAIAFFGDGAVGQGAIHEAMNLAGLYELPMIFVIENNQYAMGTATHRAFSQPDFYHMGASYNMPSSLTNGMDVLTCYKAFSDHVALARENQPSLMEIRTYRYRGHSMSDPQKYRTKEELESKKNEDPIIRLKAYLLENDLADNDALDQIDEEVKQQVMDSVEFAENSPFPDESTIYEDVYVQEDYPFLTD